TQAALIVPLLFAPVWTFLLRQAMKQIPEVYLEAVRLESNRLTDVLCHAILPACRTGILTVVVLSFAEVWNMVEQPLIYLTDPSSYPLSLALSQMTGSYLSSYYAACVVFVFPALILWRMFSDEVVERIGQLKVRGHL
ncbi:MAG TPA: carbohydrate ABC transporter permease, partial [Chloroflexi bacterium]|nr:carbohydrate ABC transporter permease [Chloroflexota bacterium]